MDLFEEYTNFYNEDNEDDMPAEIYYQAGCYEADKGNMDEAISLFEEALARGEIGAADALISVYKDIIEIYSYEENESEYYRYKLLLAQKMQEYGKVIESELRRKYRKI